MSREPACALAAALALAGCETPERRAEIYNPVSGGTQAITITAYAQDIAPPAPPYYVASTVATITPLQDVACTVRNDKGSWTVTVPGKVVVSVGGTLRVECAKAGYHPSGGSVPCTNPKVRGAVEGAMTVLTLLGPVGVVGAAIAAPGLLAGSLVAGGAVGEASSASAAGAEGRDACDYEFTSLGIRFHRAD